jgi:hypothetical protein
MIKVVLVGGLCLTAVIMGVSRLRLSLAVGEQGVQVWFYDESERKLYAVARDTIPPHEGIGGTTGDGVRAIVVACPADRDDASRRRIAYLETYAPELKRLQEDLRAARAAGRACGRPIPTGESGFFEKNTLVRRPDEPTWHDMTTPAARAIIRQSRSSPCPDGSSPLICSP